MPKYIEISRFLLALLSSYIITKLLPLSIMLVAQLLHFTFFTKEVVFAYGSVGLSVCLSVCLFVDNITQKSYKRIGMKFYGDVLGSTMKK